MTSKQVTLFVTFFIKPDKLEEWKEAHRPVWAACAAEPECLYFDVFKRSQTDNEIEMRLVEIWNGDQEWFEKHQFSKPYYDSLWPKSKPTWVREFEIEFFERLGEGFSCKSDELRNK